jgi:DNA end-binding protein Ku
MRALRKLSINFGLVNTPCKVFTATGDPAAVYAFHLYHDGCMGRIKMPKVCDKCGEKLSPQEIVSGTEVGDKVVIVTQEQLDELKEEQNGIEVLEFVPSSEIEPILLDSPYYLEADGDAAVKGYNMLRQVLWEEQKTAVVQFTLKTRTTLGVLRAEVRVKNDGTSHVVLVAQTLRWPDEIRDTSGLKMVDKVVKIKPGELDMARKVVKAYSVETFDPAKYKDLYSLRRTELVTTLAAGEEFTPVAKPEPKVDVDDMQALLEATLKAKREAA